MSPLRRHAVVGQDAYAIFAADGPDGSGDLFAVRGDGGPVVQITFTAVVEAGPALSPDGRMVAFLRGRTPRDSVSGAVWVMHLLTGAERRIALPPGVVPDAVGWSGDGGTLFVRAGALAYRAGPPPFAGAARRVPSELRSAADSSFAIYVGDPPFARVVPCGGGLCAQPDTGAAAPFAASAHDPARWGTDSVGYFVGDELVVRPLGPGRARWVTWDRPPPRPRDLTFFPGTR